MNCYLNKSKLSFYKFVMKNSIIIFINIPRKMVILVYDPNITACIIVWRWFILKKIDKNAVFIQ